MELAVAAAWNAIAMQEGVADDATAPPALKAKLRDDADRFFGVAEDDAGVTRIDEARLQRAPASAAAPIRRMPFADRLGWLAAAVFAAVLLFTNWPALDSTSLDAIDARARLIDAGTPALPWLQPELPEYATVTGDVVWNDERQEGYLRLIGMPANDPLRTQYQLWIVDRSRDANPVDGGVFDIPAGGGEIVIPIDAKLRVSDPEAFAITREKPGGVVVSSGPLLVVAAAG